MWNSMFFYLKKAKNEQNKQIKYKTSYWKKSVSFSTKVLIIVDDMPETGLPFYVVICIMQSCGNFQGKGSTFIFQFNILKTLSFGLAMGVGHVMSASTIMCSTVWDSPAAVKQYQFKS